jgi:predicted membrane channel-forming protein YqfA (hemolysin III family)
MVEWLLNRVTIVSLAVIGGVFSLMASWCASRNLISEQNIRRLNKSAYVLMAVSMILFVATGIFGSGNQR